MTDQMTAVDRLEQAERRIEWVLSHPGASDWLKACLRMVRSHHPVQALNDLEVLGLLVRERSVALVDGLLVPAAQTPGNLPPDPPTDRADADSGEDIGAATFTVHE